MFSLSHPPFGFGTHRDILDTCDLWDIWSEWWESMTRPTKGQRQRQKQIQWQIHLENSAILETFDLKLKVQDSTLLNCNKCQWSSKTQRVLTRHIRASHPKDFIPWSETTPLILWFLLWWTYFKWLTSRTNKKKYNNLSCRTLNVPDEE